MLKFYNDRENTSEIRDAKNITKAVIVRIVLITHGFVAAWRASVVRKDSWIWLIGLLNSLLIAETLYIAIKRKGQERKWFCPCCLLFLLVNVPSMWILKLDLLGRFDANLKNGNISFIQTEAITTIRGITVSFPFTVVGWANLLEQTMVFLLIIGRWSLPRGELTRTQLSQLLFILIGTGADVLEICVVFEEAEVRSNRVLCVTTLIVWSVSLLQFTFVLTAIRDEEKIDESSSLFSKILATDIWSLLLSTTLHDLPYFCLRMYVLIYIHVFSYGILFFTCKNFILIAAVIYRIDVFCFPKKKYEELG